MFTVYVYQLGEPKNVATVLDPTDASDLAIKKAIEFGFSVIAAREGQTAYVFDTPTGTMTACGTHPAFRDVVVDPQSLTPIQDSGY